MSIKTGMISLLIIAMLTLCTLNSAVASTSKPITASHVDHITDATAEQRPVFTLAFQNDSGRTLECTQILYEGQNHLFYVTGRLTDSNSGIGNERIGILLSEFRTGAMDDEVINVTMTDNDGYFIAPVVIHQFGVFFVSAIWNGNSQYVLQETDSSYRTNYLCVLVENTYSPVGNVGIIPY